MVPPAHCPWLDIHRSDDPSGVPVIDRAAASDDGDTRTAPWAGVEPSERRSEGTSDLPESTAASDE